MRGQRTGGFYRQLAGLIILGLVLTVSAARAATETVPVDGVAFDVRKPWVENLRALEGIRVNLTLRSGTVIGGKVRGVGEQLLHLEQLDGKEFSDALIRVEDIAAVDARVRQPKR